MSSDTREVSIVCATALEGSVSYTGSTWACTLTNLSEGTNNISATAVDLVGNKSTPAATSIIVDTTSPSKVINLVAVDMPDDNGSAISLSWTQNTEGDLFQYNIYRTEGPVSNVNMLKALYSTMRNSYVDNTAIDGVEYYYAVTAVDNCGNEDSEVINAGPVSSMDNMYY